MKIDTKIRPSDLRGLCRQLFELAASKVRAIDRTWNPSQGTPVFTVKGKYTTRGWTEWTQGFQYGCAILVYDATGDRKMLELGRKCTVRRMLPHVSHMGVHDHGFNNLSTYGNLHRLMREGRIRHNAWEMAFYEMAIKVSGAVQAARWATTADGLGYIYSFNGPHSLFVDTMRTIRVLGAAHQLGHVLMGENDRPINLLGRSIQHGLATEKYVLLHGDTDHVYDVPGRTCHEAVFNRQDGQFRCRATQQGYSPFTTWTRGLAWAMLGYAEQLEMLKAFPPADVQSACALSRSHVMKIYERAAKSTSDHFINDCTTVDGICPWDDGAPGLSQMNNWREQIADPCNDYEPMDSSASAVAAQGLIRLGRHLGVTRGKRYLQAGLTVAKTLLDEPYVSKNRRHQGLLLHSVYHRPNGWDYVPPRRKIPCGESSMWGDYHLLELAVLIKRLAGNGTYPTFFKP